MKHDNYSAGAKKFCEDISIMLGETKRFPWIPWKHLKFVVIILWAIVMPVFTVFIFTYGIVQVYLISLFKKIRLFTYSLLSMKDQDG